MKITVRIRNNYGNKTVYPVCEKAKAFADIATTTSLTPRVIELIKSLGYSIEVETQSL